MVGHFPARGNSSVGYVSCACQRIRGKLPIMGKQSAAETRFRERVQEERGRRKWSRADLAKMLQNKGFEHIYASTVAKIEYGERSVRIDEATAIADLFDVPLDV